MCKYVNKNKCSISGEVCPYMYFCDRTMSYKALKTMPTKCRIAENAEVPNGYTKVIMARHGYVYVDIDGYIKKIPYAEKEIPKYVKVTQTKSGVWKIKDEH